MQPPPLEDVQRAIGDRYELLSSVGAGGMGFVYSARHRALGHIVAVKVLPPEVAASEMRMRRFQQEAALAASLAHPHIVPVYDFGVRAGITFLIMPFVRGPTLERALAHVVRVATSPLTAPGVPIGTPDYMAPEQAAGEERLDGRADMYSLAVVTFETLTGTRPAQGSDRARLARALRGARPELSAAVAAALVGPLAPQPDQRPATVAAWLAAVDRARARPWRRWGAAGVTAAAVVAGGGWVLCRTHVLGICRPASVATVAVMPFDKLGGASLPDRQLMEVFARRLSAAPNVVVLSGA